MEGGIDNVGVLSTKISLVGLYMFTIFSCPLPHSFGIANTSI